MGISKLKFEIAKTGKNRSKNSLLAALWLVSV